MARRAFFSFHFDADNWRASQVRNIGAIEGNSPASDNDWEAVKKGGNPAIQRWIDDQLAGRGCTIVLIGSATAASGSTTRLKNHGMMGRECSASIFTTSKTEMVNSRQRARILLMASQ